MAEPKIRLSSNLLKPSATAGGSDKQNQAEQAGNLNMANQLARESIEISENQA